MSTSIELQEQQKTRESPLLAKPLDEALWQAWVAKGRAKDRLASAARLKAVKWVSIAGLFAAAGLWNHLTSYSELVIRIIVIAGAMAVMFQAFHERHYAVAAVFGALAVLYNPVAPVFSFSGEWQRVFVMMSIIPFIASLVRRTVSKSAITLLLVFGAASAVTLAEDLSKYRAIQLGMDLPTVAKETNTNLSEAKVIHRRPALIRELEWRPRPADWPSKTDPAEKVIFTFYENELFRIAVNYDRYETEGLTNDDFIGAISAIYGMATKPIAFVKVAQNSYDDEEEVLAQWQDPHYRFDLIHSSYGSTFRLIGVVKKLEALAQAAILEAKRLDDQEAPQREAARISAQGDAAQAKLEKARLVNKPKFRP